MNGQRASASAGRIFEVLDHKPEIVDRPGAVDLVNCRGDVKFDDVSFSYADGTEVLSHFNLEITPGETVALVGRTGSGKSTIARMINRSYDVSDGKLLIDGVDVRDYTIPSLRASVGIVLDSHSSSRCRSGTTSAYGRPDATLEDVLAAREGGRRRRVHRPARGRIRHDRRRARLHALGRPAPTHRHREDVVLNPPILVLDDATSAIDVQVEQKIHASLRRCSHTERP